MDRREFLSNASVGLGATAVSISSSQSHANSLSINDPRNAANSRVIKDARTQHGMFQGNPQHTGVYSTTPAYRFMEVSFTFRTAGPIRGTPALANGRLYFGSGDGNLYAVDARSGTEHWRFRTGGPMQSSPAVADNVVYFVSSDGNLYAVDRLGGKQVWKFAIGRDLPYRNGFDYYLSSPTIVGRSLFVGGGDGNLYAFDLIRRQPRWKYFAGSMIRSSPAVADDLVMVGTMGGELLALSRADGKLKWKFATRGASLKIEDFGFDRTAIVSSPSVANGIVTFGGRDGFLYSLDLATGKQKWAYDHKISWVLSTPAIDKGNVFAGSSDGHFFQSVDQSTGAELWRFPAGAPIWSSAAIAGPMIYFGVNDGHLFAVDKHTGVEKWRYKSPDKIFGSPIVADGVVYYGCDDGNLYALAGTTTPDPKPPSARRVVFWESPFNPALREQGSDGLSNENSKIRYCSRRNRTSDSDKMNPPFVRWLINDRVDANHLFPYGESRFHQCSVTISSVQMSPHSEE